MWFPTAENCMCCTPLKKLEILKRSATPSLDVKGTLSTFKNHAKNIITMFMAVRAGEISYHYGVTSDK